MSGRRARVVTWPSITWPSITWPSITWAGGLGAIVLFGCGGGSDDGAKATSTEALCRAHFTAVCERLEACSPTFAILDGDREACVTRRAAECAAAYLGPGSNESAAELEACFGALAPATCDAVMALVLENFALPAECAKLRGQGAAKAPCAGGDQCASATCIQAAPFSADDQPCGQCGAGRAAGDRCATSRDCDRGLACAQGKCAPYGGDGDACDDTRPCHASLRCAAGACAPRVAVGGPCAAPPAPSDCGFDLVCNAKTAKCEAPIATGGTDGARCGVTATGSSEACAHGFVCEVGDMASRCTALAQEGDACTEHPCALPLRCIRGTCSLQRAATCG
jgi:hypothetical protein